MPDSSDDSINDSTPQFKFESQMTLIVVYLCLNKRMNLGGSV